MDLITVTDYVVDTALKKHLDIDYFQLHKFMFIVTARYNTYHPNTFDMSEFQMWDYGPVLPYIDDIYRGFGYNPIAKVYSHPQFDSNKMKFVNHPSHFDQIDDEFKTLVDKVFSIFFRCDVYDIIDKLQQADVYQEHLTQINNHECPHYPKDYQLSDLKFATIFI